MRPSRALAVGLTIAAHLAIVTAEPDAWILVVVVGILAVVFAWTTADSGSIAPAPVTIICLAMLFALAVDELAIGPLVACVLALVVGDVLAAIRAEGDGGPVMVRSGSFDRTIATTFGLAAATIIVVMLVAVIPAHRGLTFAAVVALVSLTVVVHRRRSAMHDTPLPPPPVSSQRTAAAPPVSPT